MKRSQLVFSPVGSSFWPRFTQKNVIYFFSKLVFGRRPGCLNLRRPPFDFVAYVFCCWPHFPKPNCNQLVRTFFLTGRDVLKRSSFRFFAHALFGGLRFLFVAGTGCRWFFLFQGCSAQLVFFCFEILVFNFVEAYIFGKADRMKLCNPFSVQV